jgi:aconitase B
MLKSSKSIWFTSRTSSLRNGNDLTMSAVERCREKIDGVYRFMATNIGHFRAAGKLLESRRLLPISLIAAADRWTSTS